METTVKSASELTDPEEIRAAALLAHAWKLIDSGRRYGVIEGGPPVDLDQCRAYIRRGRRLGYFPGNDEIGVMVGRVVGQWNREAPSKTHDPFT